MRCSPASASRRRTPWLGRTHVFCSPLGKNSATTCGRLCADRSLPRSGMRASARLTLARDHLGLNVVMYHKTDRFFAFATMPKGLFALPEVPRELSEEKMADFIVLNHADHKTTFYRNIFRVLPAHLMTINGRWRHGGAPLLVAGRHPPDPACVRSGLRGWPARCASTARSAARCAAPIRSAAILSGGLDSSSVAALAARALGRERPAPCRLHPGAARRVRRAGAVRALCRRDALCRGHSRGARQYRRHLYSQQRSGRFRRSRTAVPGARGAGAQSDQSRLGAGDHRGCARAEDAACCSAASGAISPSAGPAGRRPPITCCTAG